MSKLRREIGMTVALVVMCLGLYASNHSFSNFSNVGNLSRNISMLGIFTVGMAFVIITGGIDLSLGSLIGLTGVIIAKLTSHEDKCLGWNLYGGIAIAVGIVLLLGLIQGLLITMLNLQPFIVTLAGMLVFRGISQTICESGTLSIGDSPLSNLANNGFFMENGSAVISWPVVIFAAVFLIFGYILHFTVFGRYVYAIGGNRDAAKYSGIHVKKIETSTYVFSAGLAAIAGICNASYVGGMDKGVGQSYELFAVTAAVLGGCSLRGGEGTVFGVLVGCAMYRIIENGINMFQWVYKTSPTSTDTWHIPTEWTEWIIGGVLLIAVALDQIAHMVQARRRTRKVVQAPPSIPTSTAPAVPAT